MTECGAPGCDNLVGPFRRHCSDVCMNVALEVAAERLNSDDPLEPLPGYRVKKIRAKNQQGFDHIQEQIDKQLEASDKQ